MFRKIMGFIICAVIIAGMMAIPATAMFDLGEYKAIEADGAMNGWATDGVNEIEDYLDFETAAAARYLYLEFTNPVDTLHVIVFGDGNGWGWPDTTFEVDGGTSLLIDLTDPDQAPDWEDLTNGTQIKILITIDYGTNLDEIGLIKALLLNDGETPPADGAGEAPEADIGAEAPDAGESAPAGDNTPVDDSSPAGVPDNAPSGTESPKVGDNAMIFAVIIITAAAGIVISRKKTAAK